MHEETMLRTHPVDVARKWRLVLARVGIPATLFQIARFMYFSNLVFQIRNPKIRVKERTDGDRKKTNRIRILMKIRAKWFGGCCLVGWLVG